MAASGNGVNERARIGENMSIGEVPAPKTSPAPAAVSIMRGASSANNSPASIPLFITVPRETEISKYSSFLKMDLHATSFPPKTKNSTSWVKANTNTFLMRSCSPRHPHLLRSLRIPPLQLFFDFRFRFQVFSEADSRPSYMWNYFPQHKALPPLPLWVHAKERVDEPAFASVEVLPMSVCLDAHGRASGDVRSGDEGRED
ncbi:hypothetical protein BJ165DRAFT_1406019 [Panaeolus papilionaceus]|nr:hypothetical protein BJ165DRAFT_1406019 [Panaeolus papilionaceus]